MPARRYVVLALMFVCLGGVVLAQDEDLPLSNWTAPPYWTPPGAQAESGVRWPDAGVGREDDGQSAVVAFRARPFRRDLPVPDRGHAGIAGLPAPSAPSLVDDAAIVSHPLQHGMHGYPR